MLNQYIILPSNVGGALVIAGWLILLGAVAMFAAIVGGGIRYKDIEVGNVKSLWRQGLLGVFGMAVALIGLTLFLDSKIPAEVTNTTETVIENGNDPIDNLVDENGFAANVVDANMVEANSTNDGDAVAGDGDSSTIPPPTQTATAAVRPIKITSDCSKPFEIWLIYNNGSEWTPRGRWKFAPKESDTLSFDERTVETADAEVYYYAATTDGSLVWKGNYDLREFKSFRKATLPISDGNFELTLNCP